MVLSSSSFAECNSQCSEEISPNMDVPHAIAIGTLVPIQKASPERRITQKEIVAGEERPKFLTIKQQMESQGENSSRHGKFILRVVFRSLSLEHKNVAFIFGEKTL
jgi:hypothetical protein